MAVTKIWPIHSGASVQVVIDYSTNPKKTDRLIYKLKVETENEYSENELQGMEDITHYVRGRLGSEKRYLVTGINVSPETARDEMMSTKKHYGKPDGIILWHAYQSFVPGEITPDEAHAMGVELARNLWGNGYEIIVSTHLDHAHIHNDIVINSVAYDTGKKLDGNWFDMKRESDRLCRIYGKSVVENPKYKGKHYAEYTAEKEGRYTWRSGIRKDVDEVILSSRSLEDFYGQIKQKGYTVKTGKYLTLRPRGSDRGMRIDRILGPDYSPAGIEKRISENVMKGTVRLPEPKRYKCKRSVSPPRFRIKGMQALFVMYCYRLGVYEKTGIHAKTDYTYLKDLRYMEKITKETLFISKNRIETTADLDRLEKDLKSMEKALVQKRKTAEESEKTGINEEIRKVRRKMYYCRDIRERSMKIQEKQEEKGRYVNMEKEVY